MVESEILEEDKVNPIFSGMFVNVYIDGSVENENYSFNSVEHIKADLNTYQSGISERFLDYSKHANVGDTFNWVRHPYYVSITRVN